MSNLVAAVALCLVHRGVRAGNQLGDECLRIAGQQSTQRRARGADTGGDGKRKRCHGLAERAPEGCGPWVGHGDRHQEFLSTGTTDDRTVRRVLAKGAADRGQGEVAFGVAVSVVEPLELVEIDHGDDEVGVTAIGGDQFGGSAIERLAVVQPGQGIAVGLEEVHPEGVNDDLNAPGHGDVDHHHDGERTDRPHDAVGVRHLDGRGGGQRHHDPQVGHHEGGGVEQRDVARDRRERRTPQHGGHRVVLGQHRERDAGARADRVRHRLILGGDAQRPEQCGAAAKNTAENTQHDVAPTDGRTRGEQHRHRYRGQAARDGAQDGARHPRHSPDAQVGDEPVEVVGLTPPPLNRFQNRLENRTSPTQLCDQSPPTGAPTSLPIHLDR